MRRQTAVFPSLFSIRLYNSIVISGFNTDIEFKGTVYHVQTEDKGLPARIIMSLVYDRGTILASKRTSYEDLASGNEEILADRLSRQHQLICAAVKAGRINELREMTAKTAAAAKAKVGAVGVVPGKTISQPALSNRPVDTNVPASIPPPVSVTLHESDVILDQVPIELFEDQLIFDGVYVIEDEDILPAEAVAVVSELSGRDRSSNSKLELELVGETKFKGGDRKTVNIMICRGSGRKVVADAQLMVKVLGSSFRPVIFHAKSDLNGLARVHLQLPHFAAGRAAILVRALADGEEVELRRAVLPG